MGAMGLPGEKGDKGDQGEKGDTGPAGGAGPAGEDAQVTRIAESLFCNGGLEGIAIAFTYNVILMSSLDLFVTGSVANASLQASGTRFYAPTQNGYSNAPINIALDVDGSASGGWFKISLNRTTLVTTIEYSPSDGAAASSFWTMPASACVHNFYK